MTQLYYPPRKRRGAPFDLEWFLRWVIPEPNSGCWIWGGSLNAGGYGSVGLYGQTTNAHVVAWLLVGRAIPDDYDLDHKCRVRCCVNPDHLEPVTRSINLIRGIGPAMLAARQTAKTHCPKGHAYAGANLYVAPDGTRDCIPCQRKRVRQWRARQRLSQGASA